MDHTYQQSPKLSKLFQDGNKEQFSRGQTILESGAEYDNLYYLASGYVKIYALTARGEQYLHIIYGPGEIFPLLWLVRKIRLSSIVEALTDCELYCVPLPKVQTILRGDQELAYEMMRQSIEQYRVYSLRVDNLEYKYASERIACRLLILAGRFGVETDDGCVTIPLPMTHQLLGSSLNLSRESVSREMEKMVRRGLVRYDAQRQIIVPDPGQLSAQYRVPLYANSLAPTTKQL